MEDSILDSVKKMVGVQKNFLGWDTDLITHTNRAFATVHQIGIGPINGFTIEDGSKKWADFKDENDQPLPEPQMNILRSLIYSKVRLAFDIPDTSFKIDALKDQIDEDTHRLSEYREGSRTLEDDPKEVSPVW